MAYSRDQKAAAVFSWLANFYRQFIQDYSKVATPLTRLTSSKIPFTWSPSAGRAFVGLKTLFSTAPVLVYPDPSLQFVVEVDASDTVAGAILFQRSPGDGKLHPCAYFSHRLSPAEQNYDVGNRELLAVVLALGKWCHWLKGSEHLFIMWTDHKNLSYLQSAKRLNPRQARWALFLGRFNFSLTFRPGSSNTSQMLSPGRWPQWPPAGLQRLSFLPPALWQLPLGRWSPGSRRPSSLIPAQVTVLLTAFMSQPISDPKCLSGNMHPSHPGIQRTLEFIRWRFWWTGMAQDTQSFVAACSICASGKASHQPSSGLLRPLPIPSRPWSHIAVDFVTGLPLSAGNTTILTIVDHFSKGLHFVPLSKLPSALQTADLLTQHVFRLHGLPLDIVSDR